MQLCSLVSHLRLIRLVFQSQAAPGDDGATAENEVGTHSDGQQEAPPAESAQSGLTVKQIVQSGLTLQQSAQSGLTIEQTVQSDSAAEQTAQSGPIVEQTAQSNLAVEQTAQPVPVIEQTREPRLAVDPESYSTSCTSQPVLPFTAMTDSERKSR